MLTHYTRMPEAVANILVNGFAWLPNRRRLASLLMPEHDFSKREPQQFGMISFTEITPRDAKAHADEFGHFGIVVSESWAARQNAQRVIYVAQQGAATDAWCALFAIGYEDVRARIAYPDDGVWQMAYENKVIASAIAGSSLWANLLQIYEYMEPATVAHQREWRIVNSQPYYSLSESKAEAIQQVSPPQGWAKHLNVVTIDCADVEALVCPPGRSHDLAALLPESFRNVPIIETGV